jgi:hypothetical protein
VAQSVGSAGEGAGLELEAAEIQIVRGGVDELDELIVSRVANAVAIRVAGKPVRWVGEDFIDHDVADSAAADRECYWIALYAVGSDGECARSRAAQLSRHQHMDLIKSGKNAAGDSFDVDALTVDRGSHVARPRYAGCKNRQAQSAVGRIEWTSSLQVGVENDRLAGAIAVAGEDSGCAAGDQRRRFRSEAVGV